MSTPFVTVLIDTYNHQRFIGDAINGVLSQDFPASEIEILVVDDGSTDSTPDVVRKFAPRVRLLRKINGGQASAFNAGIPESRGEIIAFLDGDDWWAPGKLTAVIGAFAENADVGLVGHGITEVYSDGRQRIEVPREVFRFRITSVEQAKAFRMRRGFLGTSRMAYRRELLRRIGCVPETLRFEAVVPDDVFTRSQFESEVVVALTLKLITVPSVLVSATFWNEELVEPWGTVKVRALGLTSRSALLLTTSVTGIVWGALVLPLGVTVTVPEYGPAVKPAVFTLTTKLPGVVPALLDILSHCCPVVVDPVTA